jgi:hypothetical protein
MRTTYLLIASLCLAGAVALAQQPSISSQTPAPTAASAPAASSEPAAAAAAPAEAAKSPVANATGTVSPDAAKVAADAEAKAKAQEKRMRGRGYKPVTRKGATMWCRNETELGSHFTQQVCGTAEDIDSTEQAAKDATTDMQNHTRDPTRY